MLLVLVCCCQVTSPLSLLSTTLARFAANDDGSSPRDGEGARHAKPNPAKLRSAMTSLRHALAHPLTSHVAVQEADFAQGGMGSLDDDDAVDEAVLAEVRAAARGHATSLWY